MGASCKPRLTQNFDSSRLSRSGAVHVFSIRVLISSILVPYLLTGCALRAVQRRRCLTGPRLENPHDRGACIIGGARLQHPHLLADTLGGYWPHSIKPALASQGSLTQPRGATRCCRCMPQLEQAAVPEGYVVIRNSHVRLRPSTDLPPASQPFIFGVRCLVRARVQSVPGPYFLDAPVLD